MKLLLTGASFDPRFGGPSYSVPALGGALAELGVTVGLWAADSTKAEVGAKPGLISLDGSLAQAIEHFGPPDLIHDNGIWLPHNHGIARLSERRRIPRIVSLRGMLEPWAINHRRLKKKLAWALYQARDLKKAALLHATADAEEANARALGLDGPYCVIANGVDLPSVPEPRQIARTPRTALFLSRVHPKKGLPMLLAAWDKLRPDGWELVIAGPDEGDHTAEIAALAKQLSLEDVVRFVGPVYGDEKAALMSGADLFVLPTYSENFGMVIAEALAYGVPVLTTTGAPWALLEENDCGWWVEPNEAAILDGLRAATSCTVETRCEMGRRGTAIVAERFEWRGIAGQFMQQYQKLLG